MIDNIKANLKSSMEGSIVSLKSQLMRVRTGRASATALDGVKVNYYGTPTPINQVGQISTPEARLLQIQPFDKSIINEIEKAILGANLSLTPSNDGNLIRIPFPSLTEERRKEQIKDIRQYGEDTKVSIRGHRRDSNELVKKAEKSKEISEDDSKRFQQEIQKVTDSFIEEVDKIMSAKEKELISL